ncbi:hypothetical protein E3U55_13470 [Filobacillus milosensis]|uniref:SLH domain-containing protein n=1 Tax=Filobacillus milosensis TaxID=94137 RepID=A0A4Y8II09_9BACI|nr:hypothetical protein E3U55_13470 [Filobacillus milosensis]
MLTFFISSLLVTVPLSISADEKLDYVALGDSLALGITPTSSTENPPKDGYADYLAHHLNNLKLLNNYTKQYAAAGYKSDDVYQDLVNDVKIPEEFDKVGIRATVAEAEVITISAGANDVLQVVTVNTDTGEVNFDQAQFLLALDQVKQNLTGTISEINTLNPEAQVYLMGYYNPFPYLPDKQKAQLDLALTYLNQTIKQVAVENGATYVSTSEAISKDAKKYLPNPENVHPNTTGYLVLANEFWEDMSLITAKDFTDVPESHFAKKDIEYLYGKNIIRGYGDGTFKPKQKITRAEVSMALYHSVVFDRSTPAEPGFSDLDKSMASYDAIAQLTDERVIDGFPDGTFRSNELLTRDQMAKIIVEAFDLKSTGEEITFSDMPAENHWSYSYIQTLAQNGVTLGYEDGTFKPKKFVTRGQIASFIARAMQLD